MLLCALNGKDFTGITFAFAVNFEIELLEIFVSHIGNFYLIGLACCELIQRLCLKSDGEILIQCEKLMFALFFRKQYRKKNYGELFDSTDPKPKRMQNLSHQYGGLKSTRTSGTLLAMKALSFRS